MKPNRIENLIVKYLNHSISPTELDELASWLDQSVNRNTFQEYAKINYSIDYKLSTYNTEEVKNFVLDKIQKDKSRAKRRSAWNLGKYVAILVIAVGAIFMYQQESPDPINNPSSQTDQTITLELENGRAVILEEEATQDIISEKGKVIVKQINHGIHYKDIELSELVYNTLKVPYGKKFQVTLSDGSKVFLNSGSSIRFPVKFIAGMERTVFLSGEAFFEVTKNKDAFIVNTENLDIKVLGTKFNVSAYPEDRSMSTILVEGSVELLGSNSGNDTAVLLRPKHEAIWNKEEKQILVEKADMTSSMAWLNGQLIFREVAFKNIAKKLERSYNCTIMNSNISLNDEIFTATFNVDIESIEQVMTYISKNTHYSYTMSENRVITIK